MQHPKGFLTLLRLEWVILQIRVLFIRVRCSLGVLKRDLNLENSFSRVLFIRVRYSLGVPFYSRELRMSHIGA